MLFKHWIIVALIGALTLSLVTVVTAQDTSNTSIEVRVWRNVGDPERLHLSTRPAGGRWTTHRAPLDMSELSRSGAWHQSSIVTVDVPLEQQELAYDETGRPILAYTSEGKVTPESDEALACYEALEWFADEIWADDWDAEHIACSGLGAWSHTFRAGFIATGVARLSQGAYSLYIPFHISSVNGQVLYRLWRSDNLRALSPGN